MTLHLAVALDGAGWHPAAWREASARPEAIFSARYWAALVAEAERGLLDFVTIEDSLSLQSTLLDGPDGRADQVRGRFDAVLLAARLAPAHQQHRAGADGHDHAHRAVPCGDRHRHARLRQRRASRVAAADLGQAAEAAHFGRRPFPRLDGPSRPTTSTSGRCSTRPPTRSRSYAGSGTAGRTTPRSATWPPAASSTGTSFTTSTSPGGSSRCGPVDHASAAAGPAGRHGARPRPPAVRVRRARRRRRLRHADSADQCAARSSRTVRQLSAELRGLRRPGRVPGRRRHAAERKARLDGLDGAECAPTPRSSPAPRRSWRSCCSQWRRAGIEGFRLRPGALPYDLEAITRGLTAELRGRGVFRRSYEATTLRGLLGLPRPASRYAEVS